MMEQGPTEAVCEQPLHPYTQALLSAEPLPLPADQRDDRRRIRLQGEIPSPLNPPSGCPFRPRCAFATEACASPPPLHEAHGRHVLCHHPLEAT